MRAAHAAPHPSPASGPAGRCTGELTLTLQSPAGRTEIGQQFHRGALRILRPHRPDDGSGRAEITVVNPGGGFLGGDEYRISCRAGPDTRTLLTTQSATKIYRTPQGRAHQHQQFSLAAGAALECVPDPTIAYRDAEFLQETAVDLEDASAQFLGAEIVTPGWSPDGEPFRYRQARLRTAVHIAGTPLLLDNLLLAPDAVDLRGLGRLEGRTHVASTVIAGAGADAELLAAARALCAAARGRDDDGADPDVAAGPPAVVAGASLIGSPDAGSAVVVRALADSSDPLVELIRSLGVAARRVRGEDPAHPWDLRKY